MIVVLMLICFQTYEVLNDGLEPILIANDETFITSHYNSQVISLTQDILTLFRTLFRMFLLRLFYGESLIL